MTQLIKHLVIFGFLVCVASVASAQDKRVIGSIEFEGLKQVTAAEAIAATGLTIGQPFKLEEVDAAAQKMLDSGLFKNLGYRTKTTGNKINITFQVEESKSGDSPVVLDNFIWFTDDQLLEAIHREVPTYSGRLPNEGKLPEAIVRALQRLLTEQNIGGRVEYSGQQDLSGRMLAHVFTVAGVKMPICTLHFPGAKNISEDKLRHVTKEELAAADYSSEVVRGFADLKLLALYREVGQLQAKFGAPHGKPDAGCPNGVDVTVPVSEGLIYAWDAPQWSGMNVLTADQLNNLLGMKSGDVANGLKFDRGTLEVVKAYGRQGYIDARLQSKAEFNDSSQRVSYKINLNEGPQYRMGSLLFKGLTERDAKALRSGWRLVRDEVFDLGYVESFFTTDARGVMQRLFEERHDSGKAAPQIQTRLERHKDTLTVDVTLELVN